MKSSSWRVRNDGHSTTRQIPTSSTDRLGGVIYNRMTILLFPPVFLLWVLLVLPDIPYRVSSFHTDCAWNQLHPTSTGNSHTPYRLSLQSAMRSAYFRLFFSIASSHISSRDTASSIATNVFDCWNTSKASVFRLVSTMLRKTRFLFRSTLSYQPCPLSSTDFRLGSHLSAVASPCLTNWICHDFWSVGRFLLLSTSSTSASSRKTLSCRHLHVYLPWVNGTRHPNRICAIIPLLPHSLQFGSST